MKYPKSTEPQASKTNIKSPNLLISSPGKSPIQIPVHQLIPELKKSTGKTYLHGESIIQRSGNDLHIHHINIEQPKTTTPAQILDKGVRN
jgi:hypothetical protein